MSLKFKNNTYQLGQKIGIGATSSVYQALNLNNGEMIAVKQIIEIDECVENELELLKKMNHANIITMIGYVTQEAQEEDDDDKLNILFEYMNCSLMDICEEFGKLPEKLIKNYVGQILNGLQYIHSIGIIHSDIKAENILVNKRGQLKITDFGVSISQKNNCPWKSRGSTYWMAPEVIEGIKIDYVSDIWSLGSTIFELLTKNPLFFDQESVQYYCSVLTKKKIPIPENISKKLSDFLELCFQYDPEKRVGAKILLQHPFIRF